MQNWQIYVVYRASDEKCVDYIGITSILSILFWAFSYAKQETLLKYNKLDNFRALALKYIYRILNHKNSHKYFISLFCYI